MMPHTLRIALRALGRHKLRTALTTLGMTIGVAAVITMVALGTGAQETVADDVRSAGTNLVRVDAGNFTRGGEESKIATGLGSASTLTPDDAAAIAAIAGVKDASSVVRLRGWVVNGATREYLQVLGTDASYPQLFGWRPSRGKFFQAAEVRAAGQVAVLGAGARDKLFGADANPIGRDIVIRDTTARVIGVVSGGDDDQMDMVFVPFTLLQRVVGIQNIHSVVVAAAQAGDATRVAGEIKPLLRKRHHLDTDAAMTRPKVDQVNLEEMSGTLQRAGTTMTALLAAIAAISLVVGGIGIMNVMLVSVSERTREIGLRRAVGAKRRDVLLQFLVEAVALSCCGGLVGIVCGFAAAAVVTRVLEWPASVSPASVALAFGIAAAVGVFFGFYPARRASRLDPIDALRYE